MKSVSLPPIEGDAELDRKLKNLGEKGAKRAGRAAINAGLTVIAKAIRNAAPAVTTRGHKRSSYTKAVGSRNRRNRIKGIQEAKAGIGVGKKFSSAHAMWRALGTADRWTGSQRDRRKGRKGKRISTGKRRAFRGRVEPDGFVQRGYAASFSEAIARMKAKLLERIEIEAQRA